MANSPDIPFNAIPFKAAGDFSEWLSSRHGTEREVWARMYKKSSGVASLTWDEAVVVALSWGWIDGVRKSFDDQSFVQRFTPRRPKSTWSKKNCDHVDKLIAEGRMNDPGLKPVIEAKADGRWAAAYSGSMDMQIPEDFMRVISEDPLKQDNFARLTRARRYEIYLGLQTAGSEATRQRRFAKFIDALSERECQC